jgi:hypothetical protein
MSWQAVVSKSASVSPANAVDGHVVLLLYVAEALPLSFELASLAMPPSHSAVRVIMRGDSRQGGTCAPLRSTPTSIPMISALSQPVVLLRIST